MAKVVALIPARSGSKGITDKNIRNLCGKPMIAYSIEQALASQYIDKVVVSTDSETYAEIARKYGAEVPFLRPSEISQDMSLDIDVFQHYLNWTKENEDEIPEVMVHLRPTHPIREISDIDNMIEIMLNNSNVDCVRSLLPAKQTPYKMWLFDEGETKIKPLAECNVPEAYNAPRQILPTAYMHNGCVDVIKSETIFKFNSMTGNNIYGYKMKYDFDIDNEIEFLRADQYLSLKKMIGLSKKLVICCDIDGILAVKEETVDYSHAKPIKTNIELINKLYEKGNKIILFTARGYVTGIDWREITENQMKNWGLKYTELKFGKPDADIYIDDKFLSVDMLNNLL